MGANDTQSLVVDGTAVPYGTSAWDADYGQRVGAFIDEATATGAHVLWVGMPPMQDPGLDAAMLHLNGIVVHQVGLRRGRAVYLSSTKVLGGPGGAFATDVASGGSEVNVRTPDGTHLTPGGGEVLSQAVLAAMRGRLHVQL
jgi:hypothetical protein